MTTHVYLDWNATAPLRVGARAALVEALALVGNPSSVHGYGRLARRAVETARADVAALVGATPEHVIFTSGGTEANNLALRGVDLPVAVSAVEHPSVLAARDDAVALPVDRAGRVCLESLATLLAARGPMLVSVMVANNETGVLQPISDIARHVHAQGGLLHCDAVQAAGRLPLDIQAMDIDFLTISSHKLGGPQGMGALAARRGQPHLHAMLRGGGQEGGLRAGTENVAGIVAFGVAAREAAAEIADALALGALRDRLEDEAHRVVPATHIVARDAGRLMNTSCLALPGAESATLVMALDLAGVAVSAGAACASGKVRESHVLRAMGVPEEIARGAIRVSLGRDTSAADIERFVAAWGSLAVRLKSNRIAA
jgi:cysteine desulfurase